MTQEEHQQHDRETEQAIIHGVPKHGWFVPLFKAEAGKPSFGYTIGLWQTFKHPEIIMFGLNPLTIHQILNTAGGIVKEGGELPLFVPYDQLFENGNAVLLPILSEKELRDHFGYGLWYNKGVFPAFQIVWGDTVNRFPWE
ncbi:MAG: DUF4262 domain-containing protein, partial [Phycisphaerae bacterium]|nr:DUF4262 domain-containing protein [Saprospiraceae bacterium]